MAHGSKYHDFPIALLIAGSAIWLLSLAGCSVAPKPSETNDEAIVSRTVRSMEVLSSEEGKKTRLMRAPLMEEHAFAPDAFEEFPQGMEVVGYDSLGLPSSLVLADYALHWIARDLWELRGNVYVEGDAGQKLYTQQLFWDRKIKKIYSNVDSKVEDGGNVYYPQIFEALDDFSWWRIHNLSGTVGLDVEPASDSTAVDTPTVPTADPGASGPSGASGGAETAAGTSAARTPATGTPATEIEKPAAATPAPTPATVPAPATAPTGAGTPKTVPSGRRIDPARRIETGRPVKTVGEEGTVRTLEKTAGAVEELQLEEAAQSK